MNALYSVQVLQARKGNGTATWPLGSSRLPGKELLMPTELVWIGGVLVVAAGGLVFLVLRRTKAVEPPHFR